MAIVVLVLWLFTAGAGLSLLVSSNLGRSRSAPALAPHLAAPTPVAAEATVAPAAAPVPAAASVAGEAPAAAPATGSPKRELRRAARDRFDPPSLTAAKVAPLLARVRGHRMAKAALETAVLDAQLREQGTSLSDHLGGVRDHVLAGVSVGITGTVEELLDVVGAHLDQGYGRIKLKIEPGWDVVPVSAVRDRFGDDLDLQVDANCAYGPADIAHLLQLDPYRLVLIEQPFAADDLDTHAHFAARSTTPVCLDESIHSAADAARALRSGAASIINIKAGRVGGYLEARRIHDVAQASGAPVWCGGMLETGVGRAANVALASLPGFLLPGDISASSRYYATDVTEPFELVNGGLDVPTGPGLGVSVSDEALNQLGATRDVIRGR